MQIQTTTITTDTMQSFGANFQITTIEQTVSAFCDCCDAQASGAEETLINAGWSLSATVSSSFVCFCINDEDGKETSRFSY